MDYMRLLAEIVNDPVKLGYAGKTNSEVANILNAVNQIVPRVSITGDELIEKTALLDLVALDVPKTTAYWGLAGKDSINVSVGTNTRAILGALFGAATATRAALIALVAEITLKSRADILGLGVVGPGHVGKARARR